MYMCTKAEEGLQTSDFRLQTSDFRLQTSDFSPQSSVFYNSRSESLLFGCLLPKTIINYTFPFGVQPVYMVRQEVIFWSGRKTEGIEG